MIAALKTSGEARDRELARAYEKARARAVARRRMARTSGDYPLLSGGDINLYALFVERAMALVKPQGLVGLLTPSGIAADKSAARFFKGVSTQGRLKALYDFENKKVFFPDVDSRFKFCVFVAGPKPLNHPAKCAFFLQSTAELNNPARCFELSADDFARANPNTGTAPIFRTRRDADLTRAIYERLPVLVDRSRGDAIKAWPVTYATMFHMTNDSHLFRTRRQLEEEEGAWAIGGYGGYRGGHAGGNGDGHADGKTGGNVYDSPSGRWVPLYVGRMIHQYDHRAAAVEVNENNLHNAALSGEISLQQKSDPTFVPEPQYWVLNAAVPLSNEFTSLISFRVLARSTDARTIISSMVPLCGFGNSMGLMLRDENVENPEPTFCPLLANLNAIPFDYFARQKVQGQNINWYIIEQLPVIPPETFAATRFGPKTAAEIVRRAVLELTYTAHDMAPFARDLGYVDDRGAALPPFPWDEARRLYLRAKLDAVFFLLYGIEDRDDVRYIYSTFPIVERQETAKYGTYKSRALCLAWMNALNAGNPDAAIGP